MYDLASAEFTNLSDVYKGPAKSISACVKGGSSETRSSGSSGVCGSENCHPSILLHLTHLLKIFLTACRPRMIQYRSLRVVRVVFTPLCSIRSWVSLTIRSTTSCFEGNKIGVLHS